jgi:hypothetical protein
MEDCKPINNCLCCNGTNLKEFFSLGPQPLVNSFPEDNNNEKKYPLAVNVCLDCKHAQLTHAVSPSLLFSTYTYLSGVSETMKVYYNSFAKTVRHDVKAGPVLEIACNDGAQLDSLKNEGFETYCVDPSDVSMIAANKGHNVIRDYFPLQNNPKLANKNFSAIVAQNVLAHVSNPFEFLQGCKELMNDNTILYIQTSQAQMIERAEYDTIYHEHISFFTYNSMCVLCDRVGLRIADTLYPPVHGVSYLFKVVKKKIDSPNMRNTKLDFSSFDNFKMKCEKFKEDVNLFHNDFIKGRRLIGYGASAKGVNFINYTGIKPEFIIDDTPMKQNKYAAGTGVKVYSSDKLKEVKEDVIFVPLAWNFYSEIVSKIKRLRPDNKDQFFMYHPKIILE